VEEDFLTAATATADAERLRQEHAHAHQVRRNRQLRGALATVAALLAVSLMAGTVAGLRGREAEAAAGRADAAAVDAVAARLAATALSEPNPGLSLLLARQAVAISESPTTQGALLNGLMNAQGLQWLAQARWGPNTDTFDHTFTPDGRALLHLNSLSELQTLDTKTGFSLHGALAGTTWGGPSWQHGWAGYPGGLIEGGRVAVLSHARPKTAVDPSTEQPSKDEASIELLPIDVATGDPAGPAQRVPGAKYVFGDAVVEHGDRLRISPNGRTVVSVLEGHVRIWQRRGGSWVGPQSVPIPWLAPADAEGNVLVGATFAAAGDRASIMFNQIGSVADEGPTGVVVDLKRARLIGPSLPEGRASALSHMAISPDGSMLLLGDSEGPVRVRRVADNQELYAIPGQSPATVVTWSPDGSQVAIGRLDGTSEVYSLNPLRRIMVSSGSDRVSVLAFVGEHGLAAESITGSIARYDLAALSPVATQLATAPIHAVDAAAGLIAVGEDDGRVTIRDVRTLGRIGQKLSLGPYAGRDRRPDMAAGRRVTALALTPDGSAIIAADRIGHLRMWSLPGHELLWSRDDAPTAWLAISPDGRYLATAGNTFQGGLPDGVPLTSSFTVWDLSTHTPRLSEDLTDARLHPRPGSGADQAPTPRAVAFTPDGSKLALPSPTSTAS